MNLTLLKMLFFYSGSDPSCPGQHQNPPFLLSVNINKLCLRVNHIINYYMVG